MSEYEKTEQVRIKLFLSVTFACLETPSHGWTEPNSGGKGGGLYGKILTFSGIGAEKVMGANGFDCPAIFWARSTQLFGR